MVDRPLAIIIEDEIGLAMMYERVLSSMGYRVLKATNSDTALKLLHDHTPEFIMSDMRLPGANAHVIIDYIASEPRFDHTFVLVVSAGKEYEMSIAPLKNARFLVKPILLNQIIEIAEPVCRTREVG